MAKPFSCLQHDSMRTYLGIALYISDGVDFNFRGIAEFDVKGSSHIPLPRVLSKLVGWS